MGGIVSFAEDGAWMASNAAWRAVIHPAAEALPEASDARLILEQSIRTGLHYLALEELLPSDVRAIRGAIAEVRPRSADDPSMLRLIDGLLRMFDDPEFGRPIWPPPTSA